MQFLSLASAWFIAALPIIAAMYLLKRTYERKEMASNLLWRRVLNEQEANRPWQKLRARWLLLLQLLIGMLLVVALMQPVLTRQAAPTGHAVIVIDRSVGMATKPSEANDSSAASRLELATMQAVDWVDQQSGKRPVTLISTGPHPEVLANQVRDKSELKRMLFGIVPNYGKSDRIAALSLADSIIQDDPSGEIIIYTDGQWADAEEANQLRFQSPVSLVFVDENTPNNNLSIMYFGIKAASNGMDVNNGVITVRNESKQAERLRLDVYAVTSEDERKLVARPEIDVPAGEWTSVEVPNLPPAHYYKAQIHGSNDRFTADNTSYQFLANPKERQALLVTEGNMFLEKALRLAGVQAVKINPEQPAPEEEQTSQVDWIVLDGIHAAMLEDTNWSKLLEQKPLWMIDHPNPLDEGAAVPPNNRVETKEHVVTSYLTFSDTHIGRIAKPDSADVSWGEAILSYGGIPVIYAGMYDGNPRLRFTFNFQDTDLPLRPEFPVLVVQAAEWMSGTNQLELGTAVSGQQVDVSFHSETVQAEWVMVESSIERVEADKQAATLDLSAPGLYSVPVLPGLYRLLESSKDNKVVGDRLLAVTNDFTELSTALARAESKPQLELQWSNDKAGGLQADDSRMPEQQISLQFFAALLLLLVMGLEWEVYRRGLSG
ncbi:vWA domain-containing protein [Paenibacillus sinopodophylli]|uniref:vWA domain-containing protein n=1 Tax=Paenibacillus sinopodophylli TaxID=1837342 RepID=UPI00110CFE64|nr:BatA and WFA domain-containing protein [Paenibacillus sinopodophylli]